MTYIRLGFWGLIALMLVVVGLANRGLVTVRLLPAEMGQVLGMNRAVDLPLFLIIFLAIAVGLLIGFAWEWLREHKHRAEARAKGREVHKLAREVERLKDEKHEGRDEVLALLDKSA